jgi:hypothetical protein
VVIDDDARIHPESYRTPNSRKVGPDLRTGLGGKGASGRELNGRNPSLIYSPVEKTPFLGRILQIEFRNPISIRLSLC